MDAINPSGQKPEFKVLDPSEIDVQGRDDHAGSMSEETERLAREEAQRPYLESSHRLADLVQVQLGLRFSDSPGVSRPFAIRELRSVSAPAVAVELSSVAVPDANMLTAMGFPLMNALVRSVQLFRPAPAASGNISGVAVPAAGAK